MLIRKQQPTAVVEHKIVQVAVLVPDAPVLAQRGAGISVDDVIADNAIVGRDPARSITRSDVHAAAHPLASIVEHSVVRDDNIRSGMP